MKEINFYSFAIFWNGWKRPVVDEKELCDKPRVPNQFCLRISFHWFSSNRIPSLQKSQSKAFLSVRHPLFPGPCAWTNKIHFWSFKVDAAHVTFCAVREKSHHTNTEQILCMADGAEGAARAEKSPLFLSLVIYQAHITESEREASLIRLWKRQLDRTIQFILACSSKGQNT